MPNNSNNFPDIQKTLCYANEFISSGTTDRLIPHVNTGQFLLRGDDSGASMAEMVDVAGDFLLAGICGGAGSDLSFFDLEPVSGLDPLLRGIAVFKVAEPGGRLALHGALLLYLAAFFTQRALYHHGFFALQAQTSDPVVV